MHISALTHHVIYISDVLLNNYWERTASEAVGAEVASMEHTLLGCNLECTGLESGMVNDDRHNREWPKRELHARLECLDLLQSAKHLLLYVVHRF